MSKRSSPSVSTLAGGMEGLAVMSSLFLALGEWASRSSAHRAAVLATLKQWERELRSKRRKRPGPLRE